jgi:hypothetical protein
MPIHDWSRVPVGTFHHFHQFWVAELCARLNEGVLPDDHYAMVEQAAGPVEPDVLTLQTNGNGTGGQGGPPQGAIALAVAQPRVRVTALAEKENYVRKQSTIAIRHASDDRIVALVEVVSYGNKSSRHAIRAFVEKAAEALCRGFHLLVLDLHRPTPRDPQGIHGAIWSEIEDDGYVAPPDKPLRLAAYAAGSPKQAFVEPVAVGDVLIDMPLFLDPEAYVYVPLEAAYQAAYRRVPLRWRRVLEE